MSLLTEPLTAPFMQTALAELAVLAIGAGVLGPQIVLRRLAFFTHGVGTATFPGLVVAGPAGIPAVAGAGAAAALFAGGVGNTRRFTGSTDAGTAVVLVGSLAVGIVLAGDVFQSGAGVDRLLFGTLVGLDSADLTVSAAAVALTVLAGVAAGRTWVASGFDPDHARALGLRVARADAALLLGIAAVSVAALDAVGALLVSALLVVPAATARLVTSTVGALQIATAALAGAQGASGLLLAYHLDVPPGPVIAVLGGTVFAGVAWVTRARSA